MPTIATGAAGAAVWMAVAIWPVVLVMLGIPDLRPWFIDSFAILAAVEAYTLGLDPTLPNPLDPLMRYHSYSDWWYALSWLGLTRGHNVFVGLTWVSVFLAVLVLTTRPANWKEAFWLILILASPPFILAANRANNDLVIFVLIALAAAAASAVGKFRYGLAAVVVAVATGLKFYPVAALPMFLCVRPRRRLIAVAGVAALLSMAVLWSVADAIPRGQFAVPPSVHTHGGAILLRDLGLPADVWAIVQLVALVFGGVVLARLKLTTGLGAGDGARRECFEVAAMSILLACFVAGISYGYRWIFVVWPAVWLWRTYCNCDAPRRRRTAAGIAALLVVACLWSDGLFCAYVNSGFTFIGVAELEGLLFRFRLATQPFVWALHLMFAGWLCDWLAGKWREISGAPAGSDPTAVRAN